MKIRFQMLQDNLRAFVWARLERGELTGKSLARLAGFQQAHLSNFLNARRGLSLQAMDRLLAVLHVDVLDLAGLHQLARDAPNPGTPDEASQIVAVVSLSAAASSARFSADQIQDAVTFKRSFLRRLKPKTVGNRRDWTRFVAVKVDEENALSMAPLLRPDATLLIDRYYNSPPPRTEPWDTALYAVVDGARCVVRRIMVAPGNLILRPLHETAESPIRVLEIPPGRRHADFIIGRVRHISMEL